MTPLVFKILVFVVPCWITNMSFQFIWAICTQLPENHILNKINIPRFDFMFIDHKPLFGSGIRVTSIVPIVFLPFFFNHMLPVSLLYYLSLTFLVFFGDLLGSIIKRRLGFKKGEFALFIDHGDYIITTGMVFVFLQYISLEIFLYALLLTYVLHPIVCVIGYKLKIKQEPL